MIRIRHNGVERSADPAEHASLADLIEWSCEEAGREGDVVVRCAVNSTELDDERLGALEGMPLEPGSEIVLETQDPAVLARSSLDRSREYADRVRGAVVRTAELFREGRSEDANHLYADALDALTVLVFAITSAGRQLGSEGEPLHEVEAELNPWLGELLEAQKVRDWVRVADYLEYEIDPILADWNRRIDGVCQQVDTSQPGVGHA